MNRMRGALVVERLRFFPWSVRAGWRRGSLLDVALASGYVFAGHSHNFR